MARIARPRRRPSPRRGSRSTTYASEIEASPTASRRRATPWSKAGAALLLAGALILGYDLLTQPRFRVQAVQVQGVELLDREAIAAQADAVGKTVFAVRAERLAQQIEERFPVAQRVTVRCTLPRQVTITVQEHEVALVWESGGRAWWIGQEGRVLGETADPRGRAVVHDLKGLARDPQEYVLGVPWDYARAVARAMPDVRDMDYALEEGLIIAWGPEGRPVFMGREGDAQAKAAILQALSQQLATRGIAMDYVDLRNQERPIIKAR